MALKLYPNIPGVLSEVVEVQIQESYDLNKPKFLILGAYEKDAFEDGTPVVFFEPYFIPSEKVLLGMFDTKTKLGATAQAVAYVGKWSILPAVVRLGKVAPKINGQPLPSNKTVEKDGVVVTWLTDEAPWAANFKLKVAVVEGKKKLFINNVEITGVEVASAVFELSQYGLKVDASAMTEDSVEFDFVYATKPETEAEIKAALEIALEKLYGLDFDYIFVTDVLFDKHKEAVKLIAEYAHTSSSQFKNVIAGIQTSEPTAKAFSVIKAWVNGLVAATHGYKVTDNNDNDIGHRITVVPGSCTVQKVPAKVSLAPVVLAYLFVNRYYTGPMNVRLSGVKTDLSLTYALANDLAGAGYTVVHTPKGVSSDPILLIGKTYAKGGSFTKLSTVMVVNEFVNGLKAIADRFIGQPNTGTTRMSMQSTMQNFVNSMVQQGKIARGLVSVSTDPGNVLNGVIVDAQLVAFAEIETVKLRVQFAVEGGALENTQFNEANE